MTSVYTKRCCTLCKQCNQHSTKLNELRNRSLCSQMSQNTLALSVRSMECHGLLQWLPNATTYQSDTEFVSFYIALLHFELSFYKHFALLLPDIPLHFIGFSPWVVCKEHRKVGAATATFAFFHICIHTHEVARLNTGNQCTHKYSKIRAKRRHTRLHASEIRYAIDTSTSMLLSSPKLLAQKCKTNRVTKSNSFALHASSVHALRLPIDGWVPIEFATWEDGKPEINFEYCNHTDYELEFSFLLHTYTHTPTRTHTIAIQFSFLWLFSFCHSFFFCSFSRFLYSRPFPSLFSSTVSFSPRQIYV